MSALDEHLEVLEEAALRQDLPKLAQIRTKIVEAAPDSEEAAEALYKLGVDALMRLREPAQAVAYFKEAIATKHRYWKDAARTSLALLLHRGGKSAKALFELRRVGWGVEPSVHSITALSMMESIHLEEGNDAEAKKTRVEKLKQLKSVLATGEDAYFRLLYTAALADEGEGAAARESLQILKVNEKRLEPDQFEAYRKLRVSIEGE